MTYDATTDKTLSLRQMTDERKGITPDLRIKREEIQDVGYISNAHRLWRSNDCKIKIRKAMDPGLSQQ